MEVSGLNSNFFNQEKIKDACSARSAFSKVYRLCETGQIICEVSVPAGIGRPVELAVIADTHINKTDDIDEKDSELYITRRRRFYHTFNGVSVKAVENSLEVCKNFSKTVVLGDIIDYCSHGALALAKECLFDKDVICIPGNHEYLKQVETGLPEKTPLCKKEALLKEFWPNDLHFVKCELSEDLVLLGLDNGSGHFWDGTYEKLLLEIDKANKNNQKIIIAQHIPFAAENSDGDASLADWGFEIQEYNFNQSGCVLAGVDYAEYDKKILDLLTDNSDTVVSILAGHLHSFFKTTVSGKNGNKNIPQYTLAAPIFEGFCGLVTVVKIY